MNAYDTFKFAHAGREFMASLYYGGDSGNPWDNSDCHGVVSDWTTRDKAPGELVLSSDRGTKRYYDLTATNKTAKRDGWGLLNGEVAALSRKLGRVLTAGEIRAAAVMQDFELLRGWCNDDWHYCGVTVPALDDDANPMGEEFAHALWGVESNCTDYIKDIAIELARDITNSMLAQELISAETV